MLTYSFRSLDEITAYLESRAVDMGNKLDRQSSKLTRESQGFARGQISAFRDIADMLRNTKIEPERS